MTAVAFVELRRARGSRKPELALQDCNMAAHLRPDFYLTFIVRSGAYAEMGRCRDGLADLDRVVSFHGPPGTAAIALSQRARLRLYCRDTAVHDPKLALADAKQACDLVGWTKAKYIGILGVAYAANGDVDSAQNKVRCTRARAREKGRRLGFCGKVRALTCARDGFGLSGG